MHVISTALVGLLTASWLCLPADAQERQTAPIDTVEIRVRPTDADPWLGTEIRQLRGNIRQFDAQSLQIVDVEGQPRVVQSEQVLHVNPQWRNPEAAAAHQLLVDKRYRDVYQTVPDVLKSGLVQWQQRMLISDLIQSADALGNQRVAGVFFLNLAKSRPPPMLYANMPLCWTACEPDQSLRDEAIKWLESGESEDAKLLGASWLLFSEKNSVAQRTLSQLRSATNPAIAQLAVAQSWRLVSPPETMENLDRWFDFRDKLLRPLQIGPTELLADRLMRIGETELAIGQWVRIASQHEDQYHRAANALQAAAEQLQRLQRDEEAQRLQLWINELRGTSADP